MAVHDIIRAWKDEDYRASLSDEDRAQLPDNPVGELELTDLDLDEVAGGARPVSKTCCACTHHCAPY